MQPTNMSSRVESTSTWITLHLNALMWRREYGAGQGWTRELEDANCASNYLHRAVILCDPTSCNLPDNPQILRSWSPIGKLETCHVRRLVSFSHHIIIQNIMCVCSRVVVVHLTEKWWTQYSNESHAKLFGCYWVPPQHCRLQECLARSPGNAWTASWHESEGVQVPDLRNLAFCCLRSCNTGTK